ncbi:uncharacterized protein LOC108036302 [Drosophila biarmipes]|uniref:uncharacterized protein LOC108036302 n=1 Tax=Drosophila biarmipes TaxID=125945 RepID=UPI0007E6B05C|nr:uncharacterized protein LOC108036302 [Drosophila biarmipes]
MKLLILLALFCQILLGTQGFDADHAHRKCTGIVYQHCGDYCDRGCKNNVAACLHDCSGGCGCIEASLVRNNGGCKRLIHCDDKIKDSASVENKDYAGEYVTDWWHSEEHSTESSKSEENHSNDTSDIVINISNV